ncbi:MAG: DMT family transporter [Deltaproteobacteria bacterium]|nr:DMT family transporter [Deltaproteobacteria bacterium]
MLQINAGVPQKPLSLPQKGAQRPRPGPTVNPYFALLTGVLAVSTGAIFVRLAGDAPALVIAAYRVGLASAVIVPLAWFKVRAELRSLSRRDLSLGGLAGFFLALHFGTWITSLGLTSVANSVVLVNTHPLWVGLFTPLITGERIKPAVAVGIVISVGGAVVIGSSDFGTGGQALLGDVLAVVGSVCAAVYLLLGRRLRRRLSLLAYICVCYTSAAVILWLLVLALRLPVTGFSGSTYACFLAMALITQLIGHSSYNWALKWFSTGLVAVSLLGEPVGSTVMAYVLFDEGLSVAMVIGGVLILIGIALSVFGETTKA